MVVIRSSPESAIASLPELVTAIRDEIDDEGFSESKIYRAVTFVESWFNRVLRVPSMETSVQIPVEREKTALPADYLQLRNIYQEGVPDSPLRTMAPAALRRLYQGRAGTPCAYAIENRNLIVGPVGETLLEINYYQRIPYLTVSSPTNWLLDEQPDLYFHAVLARIYRLIHDYASSATEQGIAEEIIGQLQRSGRSARWGAGPLVPSGIQQVSGARM